MLLFACVTLNCCLIGCYLFRPLAEKLLAVQAGFQLALRFLRVEMSATRERAFRQRTCLLARNLVLAIAQLLLIAICFAPSLLLAHYQSHWPDALTSIEAIAGMLIAAGFCAWRLTRS